VTSPESSSYSASQTLPTRNIQDQRPRTAAPFPRPPVAHHLSEMCSKSVVGSHRGPPEGRTIVARQAIRAPPAAAQGSARSGSVLEAMQSLSRARQMRSSGRPSDTSHFKVRGLDGLGAWPSASATIMHETKQPQRARHLQGGLHV